MAARLFRSGLTLLAAFVVVWIAVIVWWQSTNRMPSTADIVTYLFLLPLGMVIGYWVIKRALDGIRSNVSRAASWRRPPRPQQAPTPKPPTRKTPRANGAPCCSPAPCVRRPAAMPLQWSRPCKPIRNPG